MLNLINNCIGSVIMILFSLLFTKKVLKEKIKCSKIKAIFLVLIVAIILYMPYYFELYFLRTLLTCICFMILYKVLFKLSFYISFLYSIFFMIILTVTEISIFLVLSNINGINNSFIYNTFAGSIFSNFLICGLACLVGVLNRIWLIKLIKMKIRGFLIIYIALLFACIIFFFYVTFSNIGEGIDLVSGVLVILAMLIIVINLLIQFYKNSELTIKYDKLLDFIKKYEREIDNQRVMRHEMKNQLLTIKSKIIDKDDNNSVLGYIDEILADNAKEINHTVYAKLSYLPPNGLKGLFYFKINEAHDRNIKISINISKDIEKSCLSNLNSVMFNQIGKLFGILLDNAIEGAELTNEKKIGIEMYVSNGKINFVISNTYVRVEEKLISRSTKDINRGYGLLLAKAIINSSSKFELETTITEDLYIQKLIIK